MQTLLFIFLLLLLPLFILFKFVTAEGEVIAKQLARLGAKLILSARNAAELERVREQLVGKHAPAEVKILPLDLASGEDSLRVAVEKAESFFPGAGVDYMIHNAAYERPKSTALEVSEESLKATINVNVLGTISLTRLLAPFMLRRGKGHFVVMSSAAGKTPAPGQAVYSASKYALNGYFHTLRSELCQKGIKVTVVCPGPIRTANDSEATASGNVSSQKYVSSERCAELTIIAATHGLKEVWISNQAYSCTKSLPFLVCPAACACCNLSGAIHADHWILAHGQGAFFVLNDPVKLFYILLFQHQRKHFLHARYLNSKTRL
ncbi:nad(p)-binding rossmann-fold superfamily protein [Citrus sinensis]|nr:nad(p)-binding rossmann-fold superfamily protein [Citrus sinensis]